MNNKLLYNKSASHFGEAFPLGNGSFGSMVYFDPEHEKISLNHDTLWSGHPRDEGNGEAHYIYKQGRSLALEGKYKQADELFSNQFGCRLSQVYLPMCDVLIDFNSNHVTNYERSLDLSRAVASCEFSTDGTRFQRVAFLSNPAGVFVYKITSGQSGVVSFSLGTDCNLRHKTSATTDTFFLDGECPYDANIYGKPAYDNYTYYDDSRKGVSFRLGIRVITDGMVTYHKDRVTVEAANEAVILFAATTDFIDAFTFPNGGHQEQCLSLLKSAEQKGYACLLQDHIWDYKHYFDRINLSLHTDDVSSAPTDVRLKNHASGKRDIGLYELLFNFGRYLLISSSRQGSRATNLQGIWNDSMTPPWNSNYTTNINTQMSYWPVFLCSLPELNEPLVDLTRTLSITGQRVAKEFYDADGFVVHHNSDLWGHAVPAGNKTAIWSFWHGGSGWLCRHLFEQYEFTKDLDFLRNTAYPIMKSAAKFYLHLLCEEDDGSLILCPSTSPENRFLLDGEPVGVAKSATMSMSIVKELFSNCIKCCELLNIDDEFKFLLDEKVAAISPYKIGKNGALLEWDEEFEESEPNHRHVSHLYGLYPAGDITPERTPELAEACKKTLKLRGDFSTGWSTAWKINLWARLKNGNHALKLIDMLLTPISKEDEASFKGGLYSNLFDAHPPFQIDGNFGYVSGICEMLIYSEPGKIELLPALPETWKSGSVKGLTVKGNSKVDIEWKNGRLLTYQLSAQNEPISVYYKGQKIESIN